MNQYTFCVPCLFGLEGLVGDELRRMNIENVVVENGRVFFDGDFTMMARANIRLRMGERVLLRLGSFRATSFEELFQGIKALPLENFIPKEGAFPVKGHSLNSQLHSIPDCQSIIKKAAVERLGKHYQLSWLPETGETYQMQFSIMKDQVDVFLDTSGAGLHKRGYRAVGNAAPLRETLAAAMVTLARYRGKDVFVDPFCGSGTIVIEAALAAMNRAPGLARGFAAQKWQCVPAQIWRDERKNAMEREYRGDYKIYGSDHDPESLEIAKSNAKKAGVDHLIEFSLADATRSTMPAESGIIICNPPYGERMMEQKSAQKLYGYMGKQWAHAAPDFKKYIISSEPEFEHFYGKKASKKRKLYNGMIKCDLYMYL
ncbi:MAG: class I SAM-dependent RNA methyltransferase [Eubacteriales bacterium]